VGFGTLAAGGLISPAVTVEQLLSMILLDVLDSIVPI
jgi:hypothetical protein